MNGLEAVLAIRDYAEHGNESVLKEPWASMDNGKMRQWKSAAYLDVLAFIEHDIQPYLKEEA